MKYLLAFCTNLEYEQCCLLVVMKNLCNVLFGAALMSSGLKTTAQNVETKYFTLTEVGWALSSDSIFVQLERQEVPGTPASVHRAE
jgi:hypothetical protein